MHTLSHTLSHKPTSIKYLLTLNELLYYKELARLNTRIDAIEDTIDLETDDAVVTEMRRELEDLLFQTTVLNEHRECVAADILGG